VNLPDPSERYDRAKQGQLQRTLEQAIGAVTRDVQVLRAPGVVSLGTTTSPTCNARQGLVFTASAATQATVQVPTSGAVGQTLTLVLTNTGGSPWTVAFHASLVIGAGYTAPSVNAAAKTVVRLTNLGSAWIVG
jgi:hypothetical protein